MASREPPSENGNDEAPARAPRFAGALRWTVIVLSVSALLALRPLWAPLLLAAFGAIVAAPLHARITKRVGGRAGAAGLITVGLVLLVLAPMLITVLSLYSAALQLPKQLGEANGGSEALRKLVSLAPESSQAQGSMGLQGLMDFAKQHGQSALTAASSLFGAAAAVVLGLFVFVYGFHTFLVSGRQAYAWALTHSPIPRGNLHRLGNAFTESARGLLIGVGLTALIQGGVATIGYVAVGVPQALVLGLITTVAALIPSIGTGLVWVPVTAGLFLAGRTQAGFILLGIGVVVSVVDNFIRPALSRFGRLDLPPFLLLCAMLGGITAFGAFGLLLGPLLVRIGREAWEILHDEGLDAASPARLADGPELSGQQGQNARAQHAAPSPRASNA